MLKKLKLNTKAWISNHKKVFSGNKSVRKLTTCKKCHTFYYKNAWHFERPSGVGTDQERDIPVRFTNCSACLDEEAAFYDMESDFILSRG